MEAPPGWLLAAPAADLAVEGAVVTLDVGRERLLVVRGNGALSAFHNVCQHRGHPLVEAACRRQRLRCPYHGWTYDLEGRLAHVPDRAGFADLEGVALRAVELVVAAPFVWVRLAGEGPPPRALDHLAGWNVVERAEAELAASPPPQIGANAFAVTQSDAVVARVAVTAERCHVAAWRLLPPAGASSPSPPLLERLGLR